MSEYTIGFPDFASESPLHLAPWRERAFALRTIGRVLYSIPAGDDLARVVANLGATVANSLEAVLVLVTNGCGWDALRISRTAFEAGVTARYLTLFPTLVPDYEDFVWIERMRFLDALEEYLPGEFASYDREQKRIIRLRYDQVKHRYQGRKGKVRSSWTSKSVLDMIAESGIPLSTYPLIYNLCSTAVHVSSLALVDNTKDLPEIVRVPSPLQLRLALRIVTQSYGIALLTYDALAGGSFREKINAVLWVDGDGPVAK